MGPYTIPTIWLAAFQKIYNICFLIDSFYIIKRGIYTTFENENRLEQRCQF